jgi:hypothetical protein
MDADVVLSTRHSAYATSSRADATGYKKENTSVKGQVTIRATFCALALIATASGRGVNQSTSNLLSTTTLLETVEGLDAGLFDAYNRCDLEKLASYVADDLEFYHDQTGLSRGRQEFLDAIRNNICGKVHRDLLPGSLEAYPLNGYGAVEIGAHIFCDSRTKSKCDREKDGIAKFVMLWQNQAGIWKVTRVISYNHISGWQRPSGGSK